MKNIKILKLHIEIACILSPLFIGFLNSISSPHPDLKQMNNRYIS